MFNQKPVAKTVVSLLLAFAAISLPAVAHAGEQEDQQAAFLKRLEQRAPQRASNMAKIAKSDQQAAFAKRAGERAAVRASNVSQIAKADRLAATRNVQAERATTPGRSAADQGFAARLKRADALRASWSSGSQQSRPQDLNRSSKPSDSKPSTQQSRTGGHSWGMRGGRGM
ncbi:MAG TPA: hypothetical protein VM925_32135 [Labilithrix sp.]|nr:hypothetical protein [Labilithrix sp.]